MQKAYSLIVVQCSEVVKSKVEYITGNPAIAEIGAVYQVSFNC